MPDLLYDNIVFSLQRVGGISVYWYELAKRFMASSQTRILFIESKGGNANLLRQQLPISTQSIAIQGTTPLLIDRFSRLDLSYIQHPTIFHSSYFRVPYPNRHIRQVCTVHDFTHDFFYGGVRKNLHNWMKKRAIQQSDMLITVSEHTRNDLLNFYPQVDPDRVVTIYNGVSNDFKPLYADKQNVEPYFLYVGARDGYKNFPFAVEIAARTSLSLYVVGAPFNKRERQFLNQTLPGRYQLFSQIDNEQLNRLYNNAFALLYPSAFEGFGIPLVEAMKAGCPFIALNRSSIPEVAGKAGLLLNQLDIEEALNLVERLSIERDILVKQGFDQSSKFSWDNCFEQTLQVYQRLMVS